MRKVFPLLALLGALASCTSVVDDPFLRTGATQGDWPSLASTVSPASAVAALPGLAATTVRQTGDKGRIEQTIVYGNATDIAGENMVKVALGPAGSTKVTKGAPSRSQVEAEMRSVLSGVRMHISAVIGDNAYGPFGYASGPLGKNGSCVYAWQFARNLMAFDARSGDAAQIRLRYCSPSMSADRIVALMQGLRINPAAARNAQAVGFAADPLLASVSLVSSEPFMEGAAPLAASKAVAETPSTPTSRRIVAADEAPATKEADRTIANAVKVPMPGEAAALAAETSVVAERQGASASIAKPSSVVKPSLVPLPETLATSQ